MSSPKRIQLSRKKGYRKPEGAIVVARPSIYGNPFRVGALEYVPTLTRIEDRAQAVDLFRWWITRDQHWCLPYAVEHHRLRTLLDGGVLRGHDLACWCPLDGQPCHADILLELSAASVVGGNG